MEGVLVCAKVGDLHGANPSQAWPSDPVSHPSGIQTGQRDGGAKATGTSEVGSHRIAADEYSAAGWTGPPKRARRRETPGSSSESVQSREASAGSGHRVEAR
jgi:hypothetical protein